MNQKKQSNTIGHRKRIKDKYDKAGLQGWSDYEVLELALSYALPRKDTKPIAKALIRQFKNLAGVLDADKQDLYSIKGLSQHSVLFLKFLKDLGILYQEQAIYRQDLLTSPQLVFNYLKVRLKGLSDEEFHMLFLDNRNQLITTEAITGGTVNQTVIFPRKVVERALYHHAVAVIISHNHPAGSLAPSSEDHNLTKLIKAALMTVDIKLLDHIIIGGNQYLSFREQDIKI